MKVKVKLRLLSIEDDIEIKLKEDSTVGSLLEELTSYTYGEGLKRLVGDARKESGVVIIANGEVVRHDHRLKDRDELSLILPAAGGW